MAAPIMFDPHGHKLLLCLSCIFNANQAAPKQAVTIYNGNALCEIHLKESFRKEELGVLIKLEINPDDRR